LNVAVVHGIKNVKSFIDALQNRTQKFDLSCDNPQVQAIYNEFLGYPLSEKAKELLHIKR